MDTGSLLLRLADVRDFDAIDALFSQSYARLLRADYPPSVQVTALPIIARANPRLVESGSYFVAERVDGVVVGAGGWTRSARGSRTGDVRHVLTHHELQRHGIGRRLMTAIFGQARQAGITRLDCLSTRTAVPFYEALGFRGAREIVVTLRPGIGLPVVRMARLIGKERGGTGA